MTESRKMMQALELSIQMKVDKNKVLQVFNKVNKGAANLEQYTIKEMNIVEAHLLNLIELCKEFQSDWSLINERKLFEYVYNKKQAI